MTAVKICGIKDAENLRAAQNAGAEFIGLVFYPPSPRAIDAKTAQDLLREKVDGSKIVGLFVDPTDQDLRNVLAHVKLDMIQLHGDESPMRVIEIKAAYKIPVMKAIRVGSATDLEIASKYGAADWLLFDAKVDGEAGGTGTSFDWDLLKGRSFTKPVMLSGGLTPENVREAIDVVKPAAVDVSSGVERQRGVKDPAKITAFIKAAR